MPRRSSALARRLVEPTWLTHPVYVETFGPEVAEVCSWAGFPPDPEQEMLLNLLFAIDHRGLSAVFEFDLCAPRQNIKTGLIKQAEIGWLFVTEQRLIVHSAHLLDTTEETFTETAAMIEDTPALSKRLKPNRGDRPGITEGNGRWMISLKPSPAQPQGQRIRYRARSKTGGRGLAGDKVVLDEGQHLEAGMMGALIPVLQTRPDPQVLAAGSGCLIDSTQWREMRDRGREGKSPRQAWVEYADREPWGEGCKLGPKCTHAKFGVKGCALDDEKRWAQFMTTLGRRITVQTVRDLRQTMPVYEFARELMVWHEDPPLEVDEQLFGKHWRAAARPGTKMPKVGAIGLAADVDREWGSIAAAGYWGEVPVVGPVRHDRGVHWLVDEAIRISRKRGCGVVIDGGGPIGDLVEKLEPEIDNLLVLDTELMCDAFGLFHDDITWTPKKKKKQLRRLYHLDMPDLNDAHAGAVKRYVGDRPLVGRKTSLAEVSMLEGAIEARFGLDHMTDFSAFGADDLAMCDRCGENPHEDPNGDHDYLCPDCRKEA